MKVHIALDAMGGDRGPVEMVSGAFQAVDEFGLEVTLVGDEQRISSALKKIGASDSKIHIVHTTQIIEMDELPFEAVRKKQDSSIVAAFELLNQGKVNAVVSAGNSGAIMASAVTKLGRLKKVSRPGIAGILPTQKNPLVMMDVGANVDCRPQHLFQFGVMASAFSSILLSIDRPRVGLLSIGEEGSKGNSLVKGAIGLFQNSSLNFIGNVEGRDTFLGDVDVIVCDGFVGNVCLKVSEGLAETVLTMLRSEIEKSVAARFGYLLARNAFRRFKKRVDYAEYGGAPLLGLNGTGIVCHGRSNATAIKNAIKMAAEMEKNQVNAHITKLLSVSHGLSAAERGEA